MNADAATITRLINLTHTGRLRWVRHAAKVAGGYNLVANLDSTELRKRWRIVVTVERLAVYQTEGLNPIPDDLIFNAGGTLVTDLHDAAYGVAVPTDARTDLDVALDILAGAPWNAPTQPRTPWR